MSDMKTAKKIAEDLNEQITERCGKEIYHSKNLEAIFGDFEEEVRKDS